MRSPARLYPLLALAAVLVLISLAPARADAAAPTFADEFGEASLDTGAWLTSAPWGTQWNQHELQWYDPGALTFDDGVMSITTTKNASHGFPYTSGVITSKAKYSYGYVEMRAKLPKGKGLWPAFWLDADKTQEIDVLELVGSRPKSVEFYYHVDDHEVYGSYYTGPDFSAGFHTFAVDWQPGYVRWFVDGVRRAEYRGTIRPTPESIIANTAVGDAGSFPGTPDATNVWPQRFDIDYIRVWRTKPYVPPTPPAGVTFSRIAGPDRYATAVEVSRRGFPNGAPCVVVAYGGDYPDALAAAPLARAYGGPVLLTRRDSLPASTSAELARLAPARVYVVGSDASVSETVAAAIGALPSAPDVERLCGVDRYATAAAIAEELREERGRPGRVVVVNTYPDALSAAPLAAAKGWPILLTKTDRLPAATAAAIASSGATESLVLGTSTTIGWDVADDLPSPTRIGGKDRYDTSAQLAAFAAKQGCSFTHIGLATGKTFPDGLVSAPYLAADGGLLLLTKPDIMPPPLTSGIATNRGVIKVLDALGSVKSVSESVLYEAAAALDWS